jgi:integrase
MSKAGRQVMRLAGLSEEIRLMDLRRTGTTEMVEAGVGMAQIMSVTGHSNPQSVKPYMKNTFASADYALTARHMHDISTYKCQQGE